VRCFFVGHGGGAGRDKQASLSEFRTHLEVWSKSMEIYGWWEMRQHTGNMGPSRQTRTFRLPV